MIKENVSIYGPWFRLYCFTIQLILIPTLFVHIQSNFFPYIKYNEMDMDRLSDSFPLSFFFNNINDKLYTSEYFIDILFNRSHVKYMRKFFTIFKENQTKGSSSFLYARFFHRESKFSPHNVDVYDRTFKSSYIYTRKKKNKTRSGIGRKNFHSYEPGIFSRRREYLISKNVSKLS